MISLIDINDNAPVFQPSTYSVADDVYAGYVLENATVSTEILFVLATDEDSGSLGKVTYSFIAPSSKLNVACYMCIHLISFKVTEIYVQ